MRMLLETVYNKESSDVFPCGREYIYRELFGLL